MSCMSPGFRYEERHHGSNLEENASLMKANDKGPSRACILRDAEEITSDQSTVGSIDFLGRAPCAIGLDPWELSKE